MTHPCLRLLLLGMYVSVTLFVLAPLLGRSRRHVHAIRARSCACWLLSSGLVALGFLHTRPALAPLAAEVTANLVAALLATLGAAARRRVASGGPGRPGSPPG